MGALTLGAAFLVALAGQWVKSKRKWPTWVPVALMGAIGIVFYGLKFGWPGAFAWDPIELWLDKAWPWAVALPGLASTAGLHPALKTDSR